MIPDFLSLAPEPPVLMNATDEDLIRDARSSDHPMIRDLADRLAAAVDLAEHTEQLATEKEELEAMLEERVAELAEKQDATNTILGDILAALQHGVPVDAPVEKPKAGKPKAGKPALSKPTVVETEPEAVAEPTLQDLQAVLTQYANKHGRPATQDLMRQFLPEGDPPILRSIPAASYADVIAAAEAKAAA